MITMNGKAFTLAALLGLGLVAAHGASAQTANCQYIIANQWGSGATATIRITNNGSSAINGWNVNWSYNSNRVSSSWNANVSGSNPYSASNLSWNGSIQPGQNVEFGMQINTNGGRVETPTVTGNVCAGGIRSSSSLSSVNSSIPRSSSLSSRSASSVVGTQQCNWYGTNYPLCINITNGWGWENNRSCIGSTTCNSQNGGNSSAVASSRPASSSSSSSSIRPASSSSTLSSFSSSSVIRSSSASSLFNSSSSSLSSAGGGLVYGDTIFDGMPEGMRISEDGRRLERNGFFTRRLFNEAYVETVHLEFSQQDYWNQLTQNWASKTRIPATVRYRDQVLENVGVRFRGLTSYRSAGEKKSFNVDLEWMIDGQSINSYNDLKLLNGYEDSSAIRNVIYANLARKHIPAAKTNFVNVMVNNRNFGVYTNIQKLNKDQAKEWFLERELTRWRAEAPGGEGGSGGGSDCCFGGAFGAGISSLNDLGSNGSAYENAYTLKYGNVANPWQDLANAAHTLGVVSREALVEQLGQYLDLDATLWFLATENIFTDDDSYVNKGGMDYYLYFDVATGRILPIEYDGNTVMNTRYASSWSPFYNANSTSLPLLTKLLSVPELRQRYLAHYRTVMEDSLNPQQAHALIDRYAALIDPLMAAESVRSYSYSQFRSGVQDVKNFFTTRNQYLRNNSDLNATSLTISNVQHSVNGQALVRPGARDTVQVVARVSSANKAVREVRLYYGTGLMGRFERVSMTFTGGDNYAATIPAFAHDTIVRYYVEAIADDNAGTANYNPRGAEHDTYIYQVQLAERVTSPIVINELMASNTMTATDEQGEYGDWLELYNNSDQPIDLAGWSLSDDGRNLTQWTFPGGSVIQGYGTLIIWADDKAELLGGLHTNFKLSADGESLHLVNPAGALVDSVDFGISQADNSYARAPNGSGGFSWISAPTFNSRN